MATKRNSATAQCLQATSKQLLSRAGITPARAALCNGLAMRHDRRPPARMHH